MGTIISKLLVSRADGTIVVYDKDREDGVFTPQVPTASLAGLSAHALVTVFFSAATCSY
jgi:hypothetical protein